MSKNREKIIKLILTGIFAGMAVILMVFFEFPLPFFPSFYQIDFSDLPALVAGVFIGPVYGALVVVVKILMYLIMKPSITAYVGELASVLISLSYILPISLINKYMKNKKKVIISLIIGTICISFAGGLLNYFLLIPAYSKYMELPLEVIIGIGQDIIPAIKNLFTFVLLASVPFNLFKGIVVSILYYFIHRILYDKFSLVKKGE